MLNAGSDVRSVASRFMSDYGMILALLVLCLFFSWVTWDEQYPTGAYAGEQVARRAAKTHQKGARVLIVARTGEKDALFAEAASAHLNEAGLIVVDTVLGQPIDARRALVRIFEAAGTIDVIVCTNAAAAWPVLYNADRAIPELLETTLIRPEPYHWPSFLMASNLLNVANQIVVIAIIAIGMTLVIVTGGIDLSVGSLIALSAVIATVLIRDVSQAGQAGAIGMIVCCAAGILACAAVGTFSGLMVTAFSIPPFIVTLGMMLVARGLGYILAEGQSVYQVPESFIWLGRGKAVLGIPISVVLMAALYVLAHVVMSQTTIGRHVYAVGGNSEAARLSGVPVRRVIVFVYAVCGGLAGLGGVIQASQLKSGSPTYGLMYELYVIAAVVVGGASLSGGRGKVFGTLIGALIIAVIQNGMNLTGVESYTQKIVLGFVILGAVLLDMLKRQDWRIFRRSR